MESSLPQSSLPQSFLTQLRTQRWDDHRYYHHSRINQALHLLSALSFVAAYIMLFFDPAMAALLAWLVAMTSRQIGHFFFEPKGYDEVNQATHEHKEDIKIGFNLRRKWVLMTIWILSPLLLLISPSFFGWLTPHASVMDMNAIEFARATGLIWLLVGVSGLFFRVLQLIVLKGPLCAVVWMSKILTDPFHDISLYYKSPLHLWRGEFMEPRRA